MAVPEEIRKVPRPTNTVIVEGRSNSPYRWAVHERAYVRYVKGMKNPQPHNGKTIGYIIDGKYVPRVVDNTHKKIAGKTVFKADSLQYGVAAAIRPLVSDIQDDLLSVWPAKDAFRILAIATIRVMKPKVPDCRLRYNYEKSFVSLHYPGIQLSAETAHNLFEEVGGSLENRAKFSTLRLKRVAEDHHIAIDGMLKQDNGTVNELGEYAGKKSRVKGRMELSVLYAYDIELGEPICSEVFPGDTPDLSAYVPFIEHNHITKGILVDDKGFPPSELTEVLKAHPDLHFLTPLKRNDKRIAQFNMLEEEGVLNCSDPIVYYKKQELPNGHYLYCYRDPKRGEAEDLRFAINAIHDGQFDKDKHEKKKKTYGVIVFESDLDLPPETVYLCYEDRWQVEMIFREYKSLLDLDETRDQGDYAVIGSEFVNFIASLITSRFIRKIQATGMFQRFTYADILDDLRSAWREVNAPEPVTGDKYWLHTNEEDFYVLEKLGLSKPNPEHPLELRGKCASPNPKGKEGSKGSKETNQQQDGKNKKKGPGRPRIHPPKDPNEPKKPRGRPRIHPPKDPNEPKKPRGRPRKNPPKDPNEPKKKRGRPRINPPKDPNEPKRPRGRPKKNSM